MKPSIDILPDGKCYISHPKELQYLHIDGRWLRFTYNEMGAYTGLYTNKDFCRLVIDKYWDDSIPIKEVKLGQKFQMIINGAKDPEVYTRIDNMFSKNEINVLLRNFRADWLQNTHRVILCD